MCLGKCHSDDPPPRMPSFANPHFPVCPVHKGAIQSQGTPTWGRKKLQFISRRRGGRKALKHPKKCSFHELPFLAKKSGHCSAGNNWGPMPAAESTVPGRAAPSLPTSWAGRNSTLSPDKEAEGKQQWKAILEGTTKMRHLRGAAEGQPNRSVRRKDFWPPRSCRIITFLSQSCLRACSVTSVVADSLQPHRL